MKRESLSFIPLIESAWDFYKDLEKELDSIQKVIFNKLLSNFEAFNILFCGYEHFNEAKIILRSSIESLVLFCYLTKFPNQQAKYKLDCEMMKFKNHFIAYKDYKNNFKYPCLKKTLIQFEESKMIEENEKFFEFLQPENKAIILKKLNASEYKLNQMTFKKLDDFFKCEFRPFFMNLEKMYREIGTFSKDVDFELREMFFNQYNEYSQVTHGNFIYWTNKSSAIPNNDIILAFSTIRRIILLPYMVCKDKGIIVNAIKMNGLKAEFEKLEKMLVGDKND